jgi:hypothetical protein
MQLTRCPVCHSRISLEQLVQDEAGRELLALLARTPDWLASPLVVYLGLFRPATRDLALDRTLRLAREALALTEDQAALAAALADTVQSMRVKQCQGGWKPLANHNYLKQVLESVAQRGTVNAGLLPAQSGVNPMMQSGPRSKTAQVIEQLRTYQAPEGIAEWFTRTVCGSLAELVLMGLENRPAADTMQLVAERWLRGLWDKRKWQVEHPQYGALNLRAAIVAAAENGKTWPAPGDVLRAIPNAETKTEELSPERQAQVMAELEQLQQLQKQRKG